MSLDITAAQSVFNQADLDIWQIPRDTYRTMMIRVAELETRLQSAAALGAFLLEQLARVREELHEAAHIDLGETYVLGDSPLVTLTALQPPFDPDPSSSHYVLHPRPRIKDDGTYDFPGKGKPIRIYRTIDTRLTFEDMFDKFHRYGRRNT